MIEMWGSLKLALDNNWGKRKIKRKIKYNQAPIDSGNLEDLETENLIFTGTDEEIRNNISKYLTDLVTSEWVSII